jgi:hypothetical protein
VDRTGQQGRDREEDMERDSRLQNELMNLEKRYWNAIRDKDTNTAVKLSDDPCIVVGAQGVGEVSKRQMAKMLDGAGFELRNYAIEDVHLRRLSEDVVALAYKVKEDLVVDGEDVALQAFDSSVWQRRDGEWVCVVHTESLAGDPFGRKTTGTR